MDDWSGGWCMWVLGCVSLDGSGMIVAVIIVQKSTPHLIQSLLQIIPISLPMPIWPRDFAVASARW